MNRKLPSDMVSVIQATSSVPSSAPIAARRDGFSPVEFCLCFLSFELLLLSNIFGTIAVVGFLAPWTWIVLTRWGAVQRAVVRSWPLLLLPGLALAETLTSIERIWTLKASLELAITMVIGIIAAQCIRPRTLMAALLISLIAVTILSVATGATDTVGNTGEEALTGIFASKNAFSAIMAVLFLTSLAVFLDRDQPFVFRAAGIGGVLVAPVLLYFGRSVGTVASVFLTIAIFMTAKLLSRFSPAIRALAIMGLVSISVVLILAVAVFDFNPLSLLGMVGKDSGLTGRTHLWDRAGDFIGQRPIFGVGYRTFWRIGNPGAEELWLFAGVPSGSGFNFHNEYLEMLVEQGVVGFALLIGYLAVLGKRAASAALRGMRARETFAFLIFVFLAVRTPLEVGLYSQFSLNTILMCVIWVYLAPGPQDRARE